MTLLFKTGSEIDLAVKKARDAARKEAIEAVGSRRGCFLSRGAHVIGCAKGHKDLWSGEENDYRGIRALQADIDRVVKHHPEITEVWIEGGFNYAENLHDYHQYGTYDPWVSSWEVQVWKREPVSAPVSAVFGLTPYPERSQP